MVINAHGSLDDCAGVGFFKRGFVGLTTRLDLRLVVLGQALVVSGTSALPAGWAGAEAWAGSDRAGLGFA